MKKYLNKINKYYVFGALLIIILFLFFVLNRFKNDQPIVVEIQSTSTPVVRISGKVRASEDAELSLQKSGRVTFVYKKVGDKVVKGDVIVATDAAELYASLQKEQAKLEELTTSARPEEIAIAVKNKEDALVSLDAAKIDVVRQLQSAYAAVDDAIRNKVDQFMISPTSVSAKIDLPILNNDFARTVAYARYQFETTLLALRAALPPSSGVPANPIPSSTISFFRDTLGSVIGFLNDFATVINSVTSNSSYPQSTIAVWKADIASARSAVITANQNLLDADTALSKAEKDVLVATQELSIKQTGGSSSEVKIQQAVISGIYAQIDATLIKAPFSGIVTRQDARIGQTVQTGDAIVAVISEGDYEIEAYVPELNVSRISIGAEATITLDAFGPQDVFKAEVTSVDLSEKVIDGVPSYKVRLRFIDSDPKIKTGMTANVSIATNTI